MKSTIEKKRTGFYFFLLLILINSFLIISINFLIFIIFSLDLYIYYLFLKFKQKLWSSNKTNKNLDKFNSKFKNLRIKFLFIFIIFKYI